MYFTKKRDLSEREEREKEREKEKGRDRQAGRQINKSTFTRIELTMSLKTKSIQIFFRIIEIDSTPIQLGKTHLILRPYAKTLYLYLILIPYTKTLY